ncbi:MAG TPA: M56 family metallopeptidase, partial [Luteolibacter sp.]|nr:M56 family metallopeptidase [Luteolibacter sp.]
MNPTDELLISAAVRGFTIFLAGWLVLSAMRRSSAAARHQVLLCMLAAAAIAPFANVVVPKWKVVPDLQPAIESITPFSFSTGEIGTSESAPSRTRRIDPSGNTTAPHPASSVAPRFILPSIAYLLTILWLCGATILLARPLVGLLSLSLLRRRSHAADLPIEEITRELAARIGLRKTPSVHISSTEIMPMAFGVFCQGILLPSSSRSWTEDRLRIVLLHELTHLSRRDPAALLVSRIALTIHWFNPLAWLTARRLHIEQETACDDAVLSRGVTAPDYAGEVLAFSTGMTVPRFAAPVPTMAKRGELERRIVSILDTTRNRRSLSPAAKFNITLLTALLGTPLVNLGAEEITARTKSRGRILDRNGVVLAETTAAGVRHYPYKALAVHIVGIVNETDPSDISGRLGVEESFDDTLRRGGDLKLTLDARIQSTVEKVLRDADIGRGCAVVTDPSNGDILASVSIPSFDPNQWFQQVDELRRHPFHPFWNRTLTARPPGA